MRRRWNRGRRWPAIGLALAVPVVGSLGAPLVSLATAGGAAGVGDVPGNTSARESRNGSEDPDPLHADPLALTEEMRRFVDEHVSRGLRPSQRLSALIDAVFAEAPRGLGIEYGSHQSHTAAETFARRSGNCISFTNLLVAMAREAGLAAYFAEVDEVLARDARGEALINNKHMLVQLEIENAVVHVDLVPEAGEYPAVRRISDQRAAAHYFNNLGVERLMDVGPRTALPWFHRALELAPEFPAPWINLGVALRRLERFEDAETAYRRALAVDRSELSALSNLAYLYETWGRTREARDLHEQVERHRRRNPFYLFRLGRQAVAAARLEEAVEQFRDAIHRRPEEARFHFALGDALYRSGDLERAEKSLRRAVRLADRDDPREHYRRALEAVRTLRASPDGRTMTYNPTHSSTATPGMPLRFGTPGRSKETKEKP